MSFSNTNSVTFTRTNAKYLASKIAANLKRIQRLYGEPSDNWINQYEQEAIEYLKAGYAEKVTYGYQRAEKWIEPTLVYTIKDLVNMYSVADDDPGNIRRGADVSGADFTSFLCFSSDWYNLTSEAKAQFKASLPFQRGTGFEPEIDGYLERDHTYSSGSKSLNRSSVKKY